MKKTLANETPDSTATFSLESATSGFPAVADANFLTVLNASKIGGDATWQFFSHTNEASDFWSQIANQRIDFVPGVDSSGNPILMASDGNVDLRLLASLVLPTDTTQPTPVIGTAVVQTGNTTTKASMIMAFTVRLATMPVYIPLSKALLSDLVSPLYSNMKTFVQNMATKIQQRMSAAEVVDGEDVANQVLEEQESELEEVGTEGLEYLAVDWATVGLEVACMAPLVALPMVFEFLGHQMYHSLYVQNLLDVDISWSYDIIHGDVSLSPGDKNTVIPGKQVSQDIPGLSNKTLYSYQANFQFINSTDYGDITYVVSLQIQGQETPIKLLINVPWAGENVIWAGQTTQDATTIYQKYGFQNAKLSTAVETDSALITLSLNALSGKTVNDTYFYCSTLVVEPSQQVN